MFVDNDADALEKKKRDRKYPLFPPSARIAGQATHCRRLVTVDVFISSLVVVVKISERKTASREVDDEHDNKRSKRAEVEFEH